VRHDCNPHQFTEVGATLGDPGDSLWWTVELCRFAPGALDPYVPEIRRLPPEVPIR
jgi:hypothetical protein